MIRATFDNSQKKDNLPLPSPSARHNLFSHFFTLLQVEPTILSCFDPLLPRETLFFDSLSSLLLSFTLSPSYPSMSIDGIRSFRLLGTTALATLFVLALLHLL